MDRIPENIAGRTGIRYCPDNTGRFAKRPYYTENELDHQCECAVTEFMKNRYDGLTLPISTDALMNLVERDALDLDCYADLTTAGPGVDGLTRFFPGSKPNVRIARELSEPGKNEHRLRTTLSHEYAHVMLHSPLWETYVSSPQMEEQARETSPVCKRENMIEGPKRDWMEWQAGYCCGAILMPITHLTKVVAQHFERHDIYGGSVNKNSPRAGELIYMVSNAFFVSRDAARVRLGKLGYLAEYDTNPSLFEL